MTTSRTINTIFVGPMSAGKSIFLERCYNRRPFSETYVRTVGVNYIISKISTPNETVSLSIWDLPGDDRYQNINQLYLKTTQLVVICIAYDDENAIENLQNYLDWLNTNSIKNENIAVLFTKQDLARDNVCDIDNVMNVCIKRKMLYQQVSAKSQPVEQLKTAIAELVLPIINELPSRLSSLPLGRSLNLSSDCSSPIHANPIPAVSSSALAAPKYFANYSTYLPISIFRGRVHHNKRAAAVRAALHKASSDLERQAIIQNQIDLFEGKESVREVGKEMLAERWTSRAKFKNKFTNIKRSAFYKELLELNDSFLKNVPHL